MRTGNLLRIAILALCGLFFFAACESEKNKEVTLPTVTTAAVKDIIQVQATCGGNVTDDGNDANVARGVCWGTSEMPTTDDNHTVDGTGEGAFVSQITGLGPNIKYYVRAYATNSKGTVYGNQREFQTPL